MLVINIILLYLHTKIKINLNLSITIFNVMHNYITFNVNKLWN